jgi:DNA-binding CsgD family transcriptional regulator
VLNPSIGLHVFVDDQTDRYQLVIFDVRGTGMSGRGLRPGHSTSDYVTDLEAVVDRLGLQSFVLMGYEFGAAIEYAVRHPERVEALILRNARLDNSVSPMAKLEQIADQNWDAFLDTMVRTIYRATDPVSARALMRETMTQADWRLAKAAFLGTKIEALAPRVQTPTLLLAASDSAWAFGTEEGGKQLAALIPDARLVLFDDASAGAWGHVGQPAAAEPVIEAFLHEVDERHSRGSRTSLAEPSGLSARELEVLRLLSVGKSNQEIADELVISRNTVRRHVSHIFDKTGVANRAVAVAYARDHGLA